MQTHAPDSIEYAGELYVRYCGPYRADTEARMAVEDMFAAGEVDLTDNPIIHRRTVYIRERA